MTVILIRQGEPLDQPFVTRHQGFGKFPAHGVELRADAGRQLRTKGQQVARPFIEDLAAPSRTVEPGMIEAQ
jgi:hypothetical protein